MTETPRPVDDVDPVAAARRRVSHWRELLEVERRCDSAERSVLSEARLALCLKDLPTMHRLMAAVRASLDERQPARDAARAACPRAHGRTPWKWSLEALAAQSLTRAGWITDRAARGEAVRLHFEYVRQLQAEHSDLGAWR